MQALACPAKVQSHRHLITQYTPAYIPIKQLSRSAALLNTESRSSFAWLAIRRVAKELGQSLQEQLFKPLNS